METIMGLNFKTSEIKRKMAALAPAIIPATGVDPRDDHKPLMRAAMIHLYREIGGYDAERASRAATSFTAKFADKVHFEMDGLEIEALLGRSGRYEDMGVPDEDMFNPDLDDDEYRELGIEQNRFAYN
jgi:hypothetical protein